MKEIKKIYRINDFIEENELEKVSEGIVLKALKVIEAAGNYWASRIIERKDVDTFKDLKQTVILQLLEDGLQITRKAYRIVNQYMYNYKIDRCRNVEIVIDDEKGITNLDKKSYIKYVKDEINCISKNEENKKIDIDELKLTNKQLEILNIYSKMNSMSKTAEILGIGKSSVQVTIERIREKTKKLIYNVEF